MKEKLIKRLEDMTKIVEQKKIDLDQANADFNLLIGQHRELAAIINAWDEMNKPEVEAA